ncbi:hypothetical protein [Anaerobacillus alkaliphilus]|uniref:hypothetical protein n=1 Tax=Anaerobacillus alkaliphilus TaxID=1548597 RepID=UPI00137611CE|nr:hypothetical protein [Anaerobacillus alkaliphilus]
MEDFILTFQAKDQLHVTLRPAQEKDAAEIVDKAKEIVQNGSFIQKALFVNIFAFLP